MKEVFLVNMTKKKEFEEKELSSIKIEARVSRRLEFNDAEEFFIGLNDENSTQSLGIILVERYNLNEDAKLCSKSYRLDTVPQYGAEQNFYKFINDVRVFERLMKEIAELMGRVDKDETTLEFGFHCSVDNMKAHLLQAMEIEMDSKLKEFTRDRFFKKEEAIVRAYKGCDKDE